MAEKKHGKGYAFDAFRPLDTTVHMLLLSDSALVKI